MTYSVITIITAVQKLLCSNAGFLRLKIAAVMSKHINFIADSNNYPIGKGHQET